MFKPDATRFLIAVLVLALLLGRFTLALLLGLVLLGLGVAYLWSRLVLRRLSYERTFQPDHAFVGDTVTLRLQLRNAKLLGVPSLRIHEPVPSRLEVRGAKFVPSTQPGTRLMERLTSLRAYEAVNWHAEVACRERGYYAIGPTQLEATDPWGLHTVTLELPKRSTLVIYPRLLPLTSIGLDPRHPLGDLRAPQQLLSDPARTIGIRDYRRGDPFKAIHWGATARRGQMQSRIYEPTTSLEVAIVLDLDTFEHYWEGIQPELAERMISVAATVAHAASAGRWSLGLYANCVPADSEQVVRIAPSRSPAQLPLIMDTLAKLVPYSISAMPQILRHLGPLMPWGTTLVVIGAVASPAMQQALLRLAERGRRVLWLYCGSEDPPRVPGVALRRVPADADWREPHVTPLQATVQRVAH